MSSISFGTIVWYIAIITSTLTFIVALTKEFSSAYLRKIFILLYVSLICSTLNLYFIHILKSFQPIIGLIYRYAELWVLFFLYWIELVGRSPKKLYFGLLIISVTTLCLLTLGGALIRPFNAAFFLTSSILLYWQWIKKIPSETILRFKLFWINNGIFVYFSTNLLLFLSEDYIRLNHYNEFAYIWSLSNFSAIIKNAFFAYAFLLINKSELNHVKLW